MPRKRAKGKKDSRKSRGRSAKEDSYFDLGDHIFKITTRHSRAQLWFDRGLRWCCGFNHEEAITCFKRALKFDPKCPMLFWGIGYANGSNYNNPTNLNTELAYSSSLKAKEMARERKISVIEHSLIEALSHRYEWPTANPIENPLGYQKMMEKRRIIYAQKMKIAHETSPDSTDVAYFYIEALMCLNAWNLWAVSPETGKHPAETDLAAALLEKHLKLHPFHAGLMHLYIHCMELSPHPEKALPVADRVMEHKLFSGSGHLIHMPSHIDMWVGNYARAVECNVLAYESDQRYLKETGHVGGVYIAYRMHNLHLLIWAAMFDGQSQKALRYVKIIDEELSREVLLSSGMERYLEAFTMSYIMVLVRFGKWDELIEEETPIDPITFATRTAAVHYGRGMGYAAKGMIPEAEKEFKEFKAAVCKPECGSRILHNNVVYNQKGGNGIFNVGEYILKGEILYRKGDYVEAFKALEEAVRKDDELPYDEPWGWLQPARHALGALLSEQGHYKRAKEVYEADLKIWKKNLWSLFGLAKCHKALGNSELAEEYAKEYREKAKNLDVRMIDACFCANGIALKGARQRPCCEMKYQSSAEGILRKLKESTKTETP